MGSSGVRSAFSFGQRAKSQLAVLVADALPPCDPAAVVPLDRGSFVVTAFSGADSDTAWADTNCGVGVVPPAMVSIVIVPIVAVVVAVSPNLDIEALGHLDVLGLGRSDERRGHQDRCGCRHCKSDLHHREVLLGLDLWW